MNVRKATFWTFVSCLVASIKLLSVESYAASLTDIAGLASGKVSSTLKQKTILTLPDSDPVRKIIFGNSIVGYFRTTDFVQVGSTLEIHFLPPDYTNPIEFYAEGKSVFHLKDQKFDSQIKPSLRQHTIERQGCPAPFVLLADSIPYISTSFSLPEMPGNVGFAAIVNCAGEVVWAVMPARGRAFARNNLQVESIEKGKVALFGGNDTGFEVVDIGTGFHQYVDYASVMPAKIWGDRFGVINGQVVFSSLATRFYRNPFAFWRGPEQVKAPELLELNMNERRVASIWNADNFLFKKLHADRIIGLDSDEDLAVIGFESSRKVMGFSSGLKKVLWETQVPQLELARVQVSEDHGDDYGGMLGNDGSSTDSTETQQMVNHAGLLDVRVMNRGVYALSADQALWHKAYGASSFTNVLNLDSTTEVARKGAIRFSENGRLMYLYLSFSSSQSFQRKNIAADRWYAISTDTNEIVGTGQYSPAYYSIGNVVSPLYSLGKEEFLGYGKTWSN